MWRRALLKLADWLIKHQYVGKRLTRVVPSGELVIVAGEGKIIGSGYDTDRGVFVLRFLENGHAWKHSRAVDIRDVRYDKKLGGLVFNG